MGNHGRAGLLHAGFGAVTVAVAAGPEVERSERDDGQTSEGETEIAKPTCC